MSLFHKQESYLGVDIGAFGIKLVELKKTKGRPQLWTYGIADSAMDIHLPDAPKTPEDLREEKRTVGGEKKSKKKKQDPRIIYGASDPRVNVYAAQLKALMKQANVSTTFATASIPVSHVFHTIVTVPAAPDKEIETYINAELTKVLSKPLEEMQVVHQIIPDERKNDKYTRVLVTAAPKTLVAFYSAIFQKAGLELRELETEAFAIERSLVGRDTATMMIVDIGAERTNFFIIDQGLPMTHRSVQIGGSAIERIVTENMGVAEDIADEVKADMGMLTWTKENMKLFESVTDPIIKEVEYSFELFLGQSGNQTKHPEKIVLTGGSSVFPPIQRVLEKAFDMRVFVGDPWARVVYQQELKPILNALGPRMAVSIGLALRNIIE